MDNWCQSYPAELIVTALYAFAEWRVSPYAIAHQKPPRPATPKQTWRETNTLPRTLPLARTRRSMYTSSILFDSDPSPRTM